MLLSGDYQLYLSRTLLALFSADPYAHPSSASALHASEEGGEGADVEALLRPHLTNTCLQTDAYGAPIREEGLVKLFWELEGMDALVLPSDATASERVEGQGKVSRQWLDAVFDKVGKVLDEAVRAGVECGSFGLQLMPNAFEVSVQYCSASGDHLLSRCSRAHSASCFKEMQRDDQAPGA